MAVVTVLGGGLIGAGWAAAFAGGGHLVWVVDPVPAAAQRVAATWEAAQPVLAALGRLAPSASPPQVVASFADAPPPDLLQEALPEDLALKRRALAALEPLLAPDLAIASSSSGLTPAALAEGLCHPERLFVAHPCNPPYLMPSVELVGHAGTSPDLLDRAEAFYAALGKTVLRMTRPLPGHLVNRLQFALWREAVHLVSSGAASLADVELAVREGLAPRWCLIGPAAVFALSGGAEGMAGYLRGLGPATEAIWDDLGAPRLTPETGAALIDGASAAGCPDPSALARRRDRALPRLMRDLAAIRTDEDL